MLQHIVKAMLKKELSMPHLVNLKIYSTQFVTEGEKITDPFIVPTPSPYVVDLGSYTIEERAKRVESLLESVQFLREILVELGIKEHEAYAKGYSLNIRTWDLLYSRVLEHKSHVLARKMLEREKF